MGIDYKKTCSCCTNNVYSAKPVYKLKKFSDVKIGSYFRKFGETCKKISEKECSCGLVFNVNPDEYVNVSVTDEQIAEYEKAYQKDSK